MRLIVRGFPIVGDRYRRRMVCVRQRTRPPCWVQRGLQGIRTLCTVLSDLVNGHDVNLRDKCGVCDGVTG